MLEKAVSNISILKKEYQSNSNEYIYHPEKCTRLSDIVNPAIIKLTKEEDGTSWGNLGPISPLITNTFMHHILDF